MNSRTKTTTLAALMGALAMHCGGNSAGYFITGNFAASYIDPSTSAPASQQFNFPGRLRVEAGLPVGQTTGLVGSCTFGLDRTLRFQRIGAAATDLNSVEIQLVPGTQDTCTNCMYGQMTMNIGTSSFRGVQNRGSTAGSNCTFTTRPTNPTGLTIDVSCAGLSAVGDNRSIAVNASLTVDECDITR